MKTRITLKPRDMDDLDVAAMNPASEFILPSGDAEIGIDNRSWM